MSTAEFRKDHDGTLDEIVADNVWIHLERMDESRWYLGICEPGPGGKLIGQVWLGAVNDRAKGYINHVDYREMDL